MATTIHILKKQHATKKTLHDINILLNELSSSDARVHTKQKRRPADLRAALDNSNTVFVVARKEGRIVGMGMLSVMQKVGKRKGFIEDVVVESSCRGKGIGTNIMNALIAAARKKRVANLTLTARPARIAANKLYHRVGFKKRITNVYDITL